MSNSPGFLFQCWSLPKLSTSKESSETHVVGLVFFYWSFLFIYELGIGVYIHMKHSVLLQFIRWLCVQIRPKTDNEQLVCNFFSPNVLNNFMFSPVMLMIARKYIAKSLRFSPFLPFLSFLEQFKNWPQIAQIVAMLLFFHGYFVIVAYLFATLCTGIIINN